jgi:hypothetical protein
MRSFIMCTLLPNIICQADKIKGGQDGRACSTHGGNDERIKDLTRESRREDTTFES